ncbi:3-carboxy-cis cis-muconate cycloisomerase [Penicillium taxi]|uniref:3-carboxy-cis cis-muconate cycloisomerase n=1 Tax=Penicillium taxi TaxID=168475 RepID=UPI0025453979|nr:3-carboxy-cis cis-muconate cycloisomerase [Penicillium taxi]KAJ5889091.1 3-carboxy-cis cis-muconate cycloisomerase [Penicillium taxi]
MIRNFTLDPSARLGSEETLEHGLPRAYLSRCIDAETALARAQAACGVIPQEAADSITQKADVSTLDLDKLRDETEIVGYPILSLVKQLSGTIGEHGRYLHWGATTQDIMDTANMLQMKKGLEVVREKLINVISALEKLSSEHKATPMAGRTHLQHALPVTFGYKCAVWLSSFYRHMERLEQLESRCLLVQYGGAAGTLASLGAGEEGVKVRKAMALETGLQDPPITWHVARDGVAEIANFLALVGGSLGKVALDLMIMCSNEVGEVAEPFVPHRGASSTMPQKRNPISSEIMLAASKSLRSNASLVLDAMVTDFERASGPWHLEWIAIPEMFVMAVGSLHQAEFVLSGLVVERQRMVDNLYSTGGLIVGEAVMMGLAPFIGRQKAHDVVYDGCRRAIEEKLTLLEVLLDMPEVTEKIPRKRLEELCDPANYLGSSLRMVEDTLASSGSFQRS